MNVSLPYEIGTVLKTVESGKTQYDKIHHYIVGTKIQVVLWYRSKIIYSNRHWKIGEKMDELQH